ncbi:MAG TPA: HAMP domain-containing protein [Acidimicrobiales bacterium]|nr:HAMP domain-containing protein [Acidimicrobiales bacterium]
MASSKVTGGTAAAKPKAGNGQRPAAGNGISVDEAALHELLRALRAAKDGDFSIRLPERRNTLLGQIGAAYNDLIELNAASTKELGRVARLVGREGRMNERFSLEARGAWADTASSVNRLIEDLFRPTTEVARVIEAVAQGDLSQKMALKIEGQPVKGEFLRIGTTVNAMVDQLSSFSAEVSRVAREVGTDGKLGGQAKVKGVSGTWNDLTENVNNMASNLTGQVRNIAQVTTAVARGDLSQKITVEAKGEVLQLKDTINTMVGQLSSFADEVTRVAREVGTEGKLGGQADVKGVSGTWKDLTDNVNYMASNLTGQVRNIAQVTTAVARGDLTQQITVDVKGEIAELKDTINTMVDQLSSFADEVTRVAREVGTEGILGGQAEVEGVSGTWRQLTQSVNSMAGNLTSQVRNIAQVATAVARGDLSQKITVEAKGEVAALAETINSMTDTLSSFADEVTRVAREVGTEGRLGGQAEVPNVSGVWKGLTDNVNYMASNLTSQVRNIAQVATAVAKGDLTQKITVDVRGEIAELKNTINVMVDQLSSFADEVTRVAREVGTEGKLGGQAQVRGVSGTWKGLTDNVNYMASNLTSQVRNIAQVTTAVARGDLTQKITVDVKGEILELKNTINTMVDQLSSFADEVTRVARDVGTEGKLGGQARVKGVSGTWKDLTDNVNIMADSLTAQVRDIAQVTTAVANGDLSKKITVDVRGEILALKNTINTMVDQLSSFAAEVTRVAREVGTEGKLGGQARVRGVSGTWGDLTENVNIMAGSLTTQVRAIAEVATAVTKGDLTRSVAVEAQGEVAELKDNINQMIGNLAETTRRNEEQDWLKTNLARISGLMQGQRDLQAVSRLIMSELTPTVVAQHGAFFLNDLASDGEGELRLVASYGYKARQNVPSKFRVGESLVGQAALEKTPILVTEAPQDYVKVSSGLGEAAPVNVIVLPILFEEQVLGVIELGALRPFTDVNQTFLEQVIETIGVVLSTIIANTRTEELLSESQRLAKELQSQQEELRRSNVELESQAASLKASEELLQQQQEELQQTNEELQEKARLLAEQNRSIEVKNREIEMARLGLEEKAQQLALSSRYKSEFMANMSHELRTPLNSLLILAKLLTDNPDGNLTDKQVEFARTIHTAGSDLLDLINDILDLSKVEAGKMDVVLAEVDLEELCAGVEQSFRPVAEEKHLDFTLERVAGAPTVVVTDEQRLHQVLRNLLSNAFKFTEHGSVALTIGPAPEETRFSNPALTAAEQVVAFSVTDTGIGIPGDKLQLVFEAFQQADGTTSRRYGGTGLGLSISREIARLLGGEIEATSTVAEGSTFTLFLPEVYAPSPEAPWPRQGSDRMRAVVATDVSAIEALSWPGSDESQAVASVLSGKRVLIVDDDVRNVFALTSVLERQGMTVLFAENGKDGIAMLEQNPDVDLVLMDIMMPEMDGYETTEAIRLIPRFRKLPIIALTAKAMKGDREKSIAAGASDYITKPVDVNQLLSLIRVWLYG